MTQVPPDPEATPDAPTIDAAEHAALALENTLLRAGVDLDSEQGKLIQQAWTGRTPELEAIKTQWELVKPPPPTVEPTPEPEPRLEGEQAQAAERGRLASSVVVEPNPTDVDPREAAVQAGLDAMTPARGRAGTHLDAMASATHVLLEAAANGDTRVLADDHGPPGF